VAQGVGPEFKLQYRKKTKKRKKMDSSEAVSSRKATEADHNNQTC
jgi:hypothetical protein